MAQKWCEITVSGHKVKIDQEDRELIEQHTWRVITSPHGRYRVVSSMKIGGKIKTITLGNFLMKPPKGKQVYSRRFNEGLDFRKENLIVCTMKERQRLLPKRKINTSSRFRGVSWQQSSKKWRAAIQVEGKNINLGEYKTEESAAVAYNQAAKKYFGNIAYQNNVGRKVSTRK
jgi:AP2-like factor, euAP2 lineage